MRIIICSEGLTIYSGHIYIQLMWCPQETRIETHQRFEQFPVCTIMFNNSLSWT